MKTNAPKKIYIQSFNVSEEDAKFDKSKMFFDDVWTEEPERGQDNIEYTRTDVLIKKAVEFIKDNGSHYIDIVNGQLVLKKGIIKDFRKYMKGE